MKNSRSFIALLSLIAVLFFAFTLEAAELTDSGLPDDSELEEAFDFLSEKNPSETIAKEQEKPVKKPEPIPAKEVPIQTEEPDSLMQDAPAEIERPVESPQTAKTSEVFETPLEEETVKLFDEIPAADAESLPETASLPLKPKKKKTKAPLLQRQSSSASSSSKGYNFSEHLHEADLVLFNPQKEPEVQGIWNDDRFILKGYEKEVAAQKIAFNVDAIHQEAVSINLAAGRVHVLKFSGVPSGGNLLLRYNLAEAAASRNPVFAYLRVFAGGKELKRIQVSTKDVWKEQVLDLGILSFMARDVVFTFEVVPERIKGLTFSFIAKIQK